MAYKREKSYLKFPKKKNLIFGTLTLTFVFVLYEILKFLHFHSSAVSPPRMPSPQVNWRGGGVSLTSHFVPQSAFSYRSCLGEH